MLLQKADPDAPTIPVLQKDTAAAAKAQVIILKPPESVLMYVASNIINPVYFI